MINGSYLWSNDKRLTEVTVKSKDAQLCKYSQGEGIMVTNPLGGGVGNSDSSTLVGRCNGD